MISRPGSSHTDATMTSSTNDLRIGGDAKPSVDSDGEKPTTNPTTDTNMNSATIVPTPGAMEKGAVSPMHPSQFPDGGTQAWLTIVGSFCILIVSFGWVNCIGIFQDYYEAHQLRSYSPSDVAWITALESFCMFAGGLWVGQAYDRYGPRWLLLGGSFLEVFGLMMASISKEYYQFILSQGLCASIGASMLFYPAIATTVSWFYKKRAFAVGIVASGSGLGGIIFPVMVHKLVPEVGFGWTMRICAFLILGLLIIANLTVTSRLPPTPKKLTAKMLVKPFTQVEFNLLAFGAFFTFMGIFLPFTFIVTTGVARGVGVNFSIYLVPILNAGSIVGRLLPLFLADKLGKINVFFISSFATSLLILCLWIPVSGTAGTVVFAVLFGFTSGTVVALANAVIAEISDVREIGLRSGMMFFCVAIGVLIGSPIGGAIVSAGGYRSMQGYAGAVSMVGVIFFAALRWKLGGFDLKRKV